MVAAASEPSQRVRVPSTRLEYSTWTGKRAVSGAVFMSRTIPRRTSSPTALPASAPLRSRDSEVAAEVKALFVVGKRDAARERFAELVTLLQRRAARIAYQYLRDLHDADEAVQDAFVKVFTHITTYREELPFEVWFIRILVNRCLDLQKARSRRLRWTVPASSSSGQTLTPEPVAPQQTPEERLLSSERGRRIMAAVDQLPERQRLVFTLCQIAEQTTNEVSQTLGVSEATVRVHLFRAVRKLRGLLARER
jgi:RNA polymerase sigma-70 factor (ECF subfamily)